MALKIIDHQIDGVDLGLLKALDHLASDLQRIFIANRFLKERGVSPVMLAMPLAEKIAAFASDQLQLNFGIGVFLNKFLRQL